MGAALLIFLVFFPIAMGVAAFPLGRRDKDLRDWFVIAVTGVELAAAGALLIFQGTEAALAEVCGFGLHFQASALAGVLPPRGEPQPLLYVLSHDSGRADGRLPVGGSLYHLRIL